jgi:hypothetical protein
MSDPQYARDPASLTAIIEVFERDGFTGQFAVREGGVLLCVACHREHPADQIDMVALRRTEGASDPADMAAVVALVCPHCGHRGTVVLHYGPEAGSEESDVLVALQNHRTGSGVIVDPSVSPDTLSTSGDGTGPAPAE